MNQSQDERSVLSALRALVPERHATFSEALRVAEQQAQRFLRCNRVETYPVSDDLLAGLPRISIEYVGGMPTSGCSFWDGDRKTWIIQVNTDEPLTRQRFTLFHEYKHIVDHGRTDELYGSSGPYAQRNAEQAADFFAGCVLMPRPLMKRAWGLGVQSAEQLAGWFDVSSAAVRVRLHQIGIVTEPDTHRCAHQHQTGKRTSPSGTRPCYFRTIHSAPLALQETA